jgi:hypothetical protein
MGMPKVRTNLEDRVIKRGIVRDNFLEFFVIRRVIL